MLNKAMELAEKNGWFLCRQFDNEANAEVHTRTTAREILADFEGERIHAFVSGFGTGGTLLGTARGLKAADAAIRVVVAEPDNAPLLASGIAQQRDASGKPAASHPHVPPAPDAGLEPGLHLRPHREGAGRGAGRRDRAGQRQRGDAPGARAGDQGGHLRRHLERRHARRRARGRAARAGRQPTSSACCPTPASATCRRRCSRASAST